MRRCGSTPRVDDPSLLDKEAIVGGHRIPRAPASRAQEESVRDNPFVPSPLSRRSVVPYSLDLR